MSVPSVAARMAPRTMAFTPLAVTTLLAALAMFGLAVAGAPPLGPGVVSLGAATLVAGGAATLDDPARELLAPLPIGPRRRLLHRVWWLGAALATSATLVGLLVRRVGQADHLSWSAASTVASLAAISIAVFAVVERRRPDLAVVSASAAPGTLVALSLATPEDIAMLDLWSDYPWWTVAISAATTCLCARR